MLNVFIVRPFGTKSGIDFDRVEQELIRPAMARAGLSGGTTAEFLQQGNIRTDMFEQLLIADMVIADISIHNANVFYELGVRHALRDRSTFLIKARQGDGTESEVPFDLRTDRYLVYPPTEPGRACDVLAVALRTTLDRREIDSPIYGLLPGLAPADPQKALIVPLDFREELEQAEAARDCARLRLLAAEVDGFAWRRAGLRLAANAQFRLKEWVGAKATWEKVREYDDSGVEANTLLATIYHRLGDLVSSNQALERALQNNDVAAAERAEIWALRGRNAKTTWERSWAALEPVSAAQKTALCSPFLEQSLDMYRRGFTQDRNHFYSGLNALAMITMLTELAEVQAQAWADNFDSTEQAAQKLRDLKAERADLAVGVRLALASKQNALERSKQIDPWVEISAADLVCLTSSKPNRVGQAFKRALDIASEQAREGVRRQLSLYRHLGILTANIDAALNNIVAGDREAPLLQIAPHVILFSGHRADGPTRHAPRFPPDAEEPASAMIEAALLEAKKAAQTGLLGLAGGASGGDILFHEACGALGISSRMYLALPKHEYINMSVAEAGSQWVARFDRLFDQLTAKILSERDGLPRWLRAKKDYSLWQRSNLWLLHEALYLSNGNVTLLALWDGARGDGEGGTEEMIDRALEAGVRLVHLDARKLLA